MWRNDTITVIGNQAVRVDVYQATYAQIFRVAVLYIPYYELRSLDYASRLGGNQHTHVCNFQPLGLAKRLGVLWRDEIYK